MAVKKATATGGIKIDGIPLIKQALDDYITDVTQALNLFADEAKIRDAVQGANATKVIQTKYKQIEADMESYVHELAQYSTVLQNMADAYVKHDNNVA